VTVGFFFKGGEENAALPHFPPLLVLILNPVAELSRGYFFKMKVES